MNRVAVIIVNYNMPERTEALCEYLMLYTNWEFELFVVDNGSDLVDPAKFTTLRLEKNMQTTGGWLAGLKQAKEKRQDWLGYFFLITSAEFIGIQDNLSPLARLLVEDKQAVCAHPALTEDSTTAWAHMKARGGGPRRTWMIDNIASLWRAEWFDANGGFDPALRYGWGLDLELCWKARSQGRSLWIHEGCRVKKETDIGYTMGRMRMSAEERVRLAGSNMDQVLEMKYGPEWNWKMRQEFVTEEIR